MVIIVDYGMGNLGSIRHKLTKLKIESSVSADPAAILSASHLILPGVGHFAAGMDNLRRAGLVDALNEAVQKRGTPIMGICLGMQLFTQHSEEGDAAGLGWIDGRTRRFRFNGGHEHLRIPHVGWNLIEKRRECACLSGVAPDQRFYFTHSYFVTVDDPRQAVATTTYGGEFVSVVEKGRIFGTQFHPEKSHRRGIELIRAFVERN